MSIAASRRDALRAAALAAGSVAAGGLLRPLAANAQSGDQEALRDFLAEAIGLEQIAVLGYAEAADASGVGAATKRVYETLRDQEQAHAIALRSALDSLGFDPPEIPESDQDTGVFDDVEGLDDAAATKLKSTLTDLGEISKPEQYVEYLTKIEQEQLRYYFESAPTIPSDDLAITCAEIVANQQQHLVILRIESGEDPAALLSGFEPTASDAG